MLFQMLFEFCISLVGVVYRFIVMLVWSVLLNLPVSDSKKGKKSNSKDKLVNRREKFDFILKSELSISACATSHIRLPERAKCFEVESWCCLCSFCSPAKNGNMSEGGECGVIFGSRMQNDSEYAMRQKETVSLGCYFHWQILSQWSGLDCEDSLIM